MPDIQKYRELLTDLSLRSNQDYTRSESAKCLAGILNKAPDGMLIFFFLIILHWTFLKPMYMYFKFEWYMHNIFFFQIYYLECLLNFKKNCEIIIFMWCNFAFDRWRDGSLFTTKTRLLCTDLDLYKYGHFLSAAVCLGHKSSCHARP